MAQVIDLDIWGNVDAQGSITEHNNGDALKIALTLWLTYKGGEILFNPDDGGVLDEALFRVVTTDNSDKISFSLRNAIINYFEPEIQLTEVLVTPDYENRRYEIEVSYYNNQQDISDTVIIYTKEINQVVEKSYQIVTYIEENLYNFCITNKDNQPNEILRFDGDKATFVWGLYEFTNLEASDSYFPLILQLLNG